MPDTPAPARTSISGSQRAPLPGATRTGPTDPAERISVTAYLRPGQPLDAAVAGILSAPPGQRRHPSHTLHHD